MSARTPEWTIITGSREKITNKYDRRTNKSSEKCSSEGAPPSGSRYCGGEKIFLRTSKVTVKFRSSKDHYAFEQKVFGKNWQQSSAVYVLIKGRSGEENPDKWVTSLEVSVNKDFFGHDNADLIPYAVEHEIYEAWLHTKRGYATADANTNHLLARRRQFEMAMKDGKAEKLLEFYRRVGKAPMEELEYAYNKTQKGN